MPTEIVADPIERTLIEHSAAIEALAAIARGRSDCGRPLGSETSRQIARMTLVAIGHPWGTEGSNDAS